MSHVRAAAAAAATVAVLVVGQVAFTRESISRLIWVGIDWHGSLLALWQTSDLADLIKCQTGLTFPLLLCHLSGRAQTCHDWGPHFITVSELTLM